MKSSTRYDSMCATYETIKKYSISYNDIQVVAENVLHMSN